MQRAFLAALVLLSAVSHAQVRTKNVKFPTTSSTPATETPAPAKSPKVELSTSTREVYRDMTLGDERAEKPFLLTFDYMSYTYTEPGVMKISGNMPGLRGVYRYQMNSDRPRFLNFDIRYASSSSNKYDGGVMIFKADGSTDHRDKTSSSRDSIIDAKFQYGWSMSDSPVRDFEMLIGLGTWSLNNKIEGAGSYGREASYVYMPFSANFATKVSQTLTLTFGADLNVYLNGQTKSKMSDLGGSDMVHNQTSGSGYKLHADAEMAMSSFNLFGSVFYQNWDLAESSNVVYLRDPSGKMRGMIEPKNDTKMIGLSVGSTF